MVGEDLKELLDLVEETGLEELEVADGERAIKIRVDRSSSPALPEIEQEPVETPDPEPEPSTVVVRADRVGTFYRSAEGDGAPLKMEGEEADAGEAIAFVDSLNVFARASRSDHRQDSQLCSRGRDRRRIRPGHRGGRA